VKRGARVGWTLKDGTPGKGTVISDEADGHVLVAVDPKPDAPSAFTREVHPVIYCTVTWLTPMDASPPSAS